jgi:hypothetical protein
VSILSLYPHEFVNNVMGPGLLELLGVSVIGSLNNCAYKWIGHLFVGQNAGDLLQSFTSPAFGPLPAPAIASGQAVLVLAAYVVGFVVLAAGLLRLRDVT